MSWLKQNGAGLQNEVIYFPMIFMFFSSVVSPSLPYPAKLSRQQACRAEARRTSLADYHIKMNHGLLRSATGMPSESAPDESGGLPHKDEPRIVKVRTKRG